MKDLSEKLRAGITRAEAAKAVHLYIRDSLGLPDLANISDAEVLKDLYDCRVCVNHITQAFLRGIMPGKDMPGAMGRVFLAFDLQAPVDETEAEQIVARLEEFRERPKDVCQPTGLWNP